MAADTPALDLLVERLAERGPGGRIADLVLAAALGEAELAKAIDGDPPEKPSAPVVPAVDPPALFLKEVTVEGFRGIADKSRLGLRPGPGLTLVVGRNGSGKSTFAEAAEVALTGTSSRWDKRAKVWAEGWRCLHHDGARSIEVRLLAEGQAGDTVVRRTWSPSDELDGGTSTGQLPGDPVVPASDLGLDEALHTWRPFLSYNELGGLLDEGPSHLYDKISLVLGLDQWVEVEERLSAARKRLDADVKDAKDEAERLRGVLSDAADPRATEAIAALPSRKAWDLDALERLVTGAAPPTKEIATLSALATMSAVDVTAAADASQRLREAAEAMDRLADTEAGRAAELADLLDRALTAHERSHSDACPVCGTTGVLDEAWASRAATQVATLRGEAADLRAAEAGLRSALSAARGLIGQVPSAVLSDEVDGVDLGLVRTTWQGWCDAPDDPHALATHIEARATDVAEAAQLAREAAQVELDRRQDLWQPIATQVAAWLPGARTAQDRQAVAAELKEAAAWIADEANRVRNERFAPISEQAEAIWKELRHSSNVALEGVTLEGTKTRRRVEVNVTVDDVPGAALSVMSQGELHALALALFLPRATLPASPFRFLLIDDPVQAMDADRVDGLARVLEQVAGSRQVVVFSHDERLPDACRRLGVEAVVLEVSRGDRSVVTVRSRRHPVDNYLDDARAVLLTDGYPAEARRRVIPGLCRNAIEAACVDATRRRLLGTGRRHAEIDDALEKAGKLLPRLALALFGEADRAGDVLGAVNRRWGKDAGDCIQDLKTGAHERIDRDPHLVIEATEKLAHGIAALP